MQHGKYQGERCYVVKVTERSATIVLKRGAHIARIPKSSLGLRDLRKVSKKSEPVALKRSRRIKARTNTSLPSASATHTTPHQVVATSRLATADTAPATEAAVVRVMPKGGADTIEDSSTIRTNVAAEAVPAKEISVAHTTPNQVVATLRHTTTDTEPASKATVVQAVPEGQTNTIEAASSNTTTVAAESASAFEGSCKEAKSYLQQPTKSSSKTLKQSVKLPYSSVRSSKKVPTMPSYLQATKSSSGKTRTKYVKHTTSNDRCSWMRRW